MKCGMLLAQHQDYGFLFALKSALVQRGLEAPLICTQVSDAAKTLDRCADHIKTVVTCDEVWAETVKKGHPQVEVFLFKPSSVRLLQKRYPSLFVPSQMEDAV